MLSLKTYPKLCFIQKSRANKKKLIMIFFGNPGCVPTTILAFPCLKMATISNNFETSLWHTTLIQIMRFTFRISVTDCRLFASIKVLVVLLLRNVKSSFLRHRHFSKWFFSEEFWLELKIRIKMVFCKFQQFLETC